MQEEIYSSSYAAAAYLESINFNKKVGGRSPLLDDAFALTRFDPLCTADVGTGVQPCS